MKNKFELNSKVVFMYQVEPNIGTIISARIIHTHTNEEFVMYEIKCDDNSIKMVEEKLVLFDTRDIEDNKLNKEIERAYISFLDKAKSNINEKFSKLNP